MPLFSKNLWYSWVFSQISSPRSSLLSCKFLLFDPFFFSLTLVTLFSREKDREKGGCHTAKATEETLSSENHVEKTFEDSLEVSSLFFRSIEPSASWSKKALETVLSPTFAWIPLEEGNLTMARKENKVRIESRRSSISKRSLIRLQSYTSSGKEEQSISHYHKASGLNIRTCIYRQSTMKNRDRYWRHVSSPQQFTDSTKYQQLQDHQHLQSV